MRGEEDGDEEIHWVEFGGGDGFLELDGEGGGDLVKEDFESPGPRAVACRAAAAQPCCTTLPPSTLVTVPGEVLRPGVGWQGEPAQHCTADGGLVALVAVQGSPGGHRVWLAG